MNKLNRRSFLKSIPLLFVAARNLKSETVVENKFETGDSVVFFEKYREIGIYRIGLVKIEDDKICVYNSGHCTIFGTKEKPINELILLPRREDCSPWIWKNNHF